MIIENQDIYVDDYDVICVPINLYLSLGETNTQLFIKNNFPQVNKKLKHLQEIDVMHMGDVYDFEDGKIYLMVVQQFTPKNNYLNTEKFINYSSIVACANEINDKIYELDFLPMPKDYVKPKVLMPLFGDDPYYGGRSDVVKELFDESALYIDIQYFNENNCKLWSKRDANYKRS